jgi:pectate lyase C
MTSSSLRPAAAALLCASIVCLAACAGSSNGSPSDQNPIGAAGMAAPASGGAGAGQPPASPTAGTSAASGAFGSPGVGAAGISGASGTGSAGQGAAGGAISGAGGSAAGAGGATAGAAAPDAGSDDAGEPDASEPMPDAAIGEGGEVSTTIVVRAGQTYDGRNLRYRANPDTLGDGSQDEGQMPVFRLEDGARLINVVLGAPAADGIHTYGDATLENIVWEDVGEDALTIRESGTVVLDGGSATEAEDKIFQINAASTFRVSNFTASNAGKFIRQNGGTTFRVDVVIDECDISNMDEAIFRTDSSTSTVRMTNTRYSNIGDELFMGVNPANITQMNNTPY